MNLNTWGSRGKGASSEEKTGGKCPINDRRKCENEGFKAISNRILFPVTSFDMCVTAKRILLNG